MMVLLILLISFATVLASNRNHQPYNRLFEDLMNRYNRLVRPALNPNHTINIEFKLHLGMLVDVHEKDQVLTTNGWLHHRWLDPRLKWRPVEYGGVREIHIPGEMLWLPDIILYNNAQGSPSVSAITKAVVTSDGTVTWMAPVIYESFCNIDIEWYPYDIQECELKFGSWTYSGTQLNLIHPRTDNVLLEMKGKEQTWRVERGVDLSAFQESVEWDLLSVEGMRHEKWYPCCDYPSIDITYRLVIRRKKLFFTVNLVAPCASIAALTSWVFYLPCESHQKIQLCISVYVALTLFVLLLAELIPPTSLVMPLMLKYLVFTLLMVSLSVVSTVSVQQMHYRTSKDMPDWMKKVFIRWFGRALLISRKTKEANFHRQAQHHKQINALSAMSILEKHFQKTIFDIEMASKKKTKPMKTINSMFMELPLLARSRSVRHGGNEVQTDSRRSFRCLEGQKLVAGANSNVREKLRNAEKNVHYIANTLTERRRQNECEADWQFVSLVIDRILLIAFAAVISIGSAWLLLSAPSITDQRLGLTRTTPK